jgi:hypothetical protein
MNITKFVEWPVVDKVPCRKDVLYTGHMYTCAVPCVEPVYCSGIPSTTGTCVRNFALRWIIGIETKSSRG